MIPYAQLPTEDDEGIYTKTSSWISISPFRDYKDMKGEVTYGDVTEDKGDGMQIKKEIKEEGQGASVTSTATPSSSSGSLFTDNDDREGEVKCEHAVEDGNYEIQVVKEGKDETAEGKMDFNRMKQLLSFTKRFLNFGWTTVGKMKHVLHHVTNQYTLDTMADAAIDDFRTHYDQDYYASHYQRLKKELDKLYKKDSPNIHCSTCFCSKFKSERDRQQRRQNINLKFNTLSLLESHVDFYLRIRGGKDIQNQIERVQQNVNDHFKQIDDLNHLLQPVQNKPKSTLCLREIDRFKDLKFQREVTSRKLHSLLKLKEQLTKIYNWVEELKSQADIRLEWDIVKNVLAEQQQQHTDIDHTEGEFDRILKSGEDISKHIHQSKLDSEDFYTRLSQLHDTIALPELIDDITVKVLDVGKFSEIDSDDDKYYNQLTESHS